MTLRDKLALRAQVLCCIRRYFADTGVLEVSTPVLSQAGNTDPMIESFQTTYVGAQTSSSPIRWLRTSPEFFHKRLLCAGSGSIFEIGPVFRQGELSPRHNPEFQMLEWYRVGYDHHQLMDDVRSLLTTIYRDVGKPPPNFRTLRFVDWFRDQAGVDLDASTPDYAVAAQASGIVAPVDLTGDQWCDWIRSIVLEPRLAGAGATFIYDFPASQAALARLTDNPAYAARFELYLGAVELANGYHELSDPSEQRRRWQVDQSRRLELGLPVPPMDEAMLSALDIGLPDCAGVALGLDRLLLALSGKTALDSVLVFPFQMA